MSYAIYLYYFFSSKQKFYVISIAFRPTGFPILSYLPATCRNCRNCRPRLQSAELPAPGPSGLWWGRDKPGPVPGPWPGPSAWWWGRDKPGPAGIETLWLGLQLALEGGCFCKKDCEQFLYSFCTVSVRTRLLYSFLKSHQKTNTNWLHASQSNVLG